MTVTDTIVAIATSPGRGGIGVVRLSGADALAIVGPLLRLARPLVHGRVRRAKVLDLQTGAVLDEAVVTYMAAPRSYTTEDVVEISCHGAPVLLAAVLAGCVAHGARLAEPGEFTQRAYLAGRLDLTEAEAVHDLVAATTLAQASTAAAQLGGAVARAVRVPRETLLNLIAELEAGIDFAEDDLDLISAADLRDRLREIAVSLGLLAETYQFGRVLHSGLTLAVAGRPNAGKSSLFNRLLGQERAIVTSLPGTTRDTVTETLELNGIPVRLVDTAGIRDVPEGEAGEAERQGITRSREAVAEADMVLLVEEARVALEGNLPDTPEDLGLGLATGDPDAGGRPGLRVLTKADLLSADEAARASALQGAVLTSAVSGEGMDNLREAILTRVTGPGSAGMEGAVVANLRQHTALAAALGSVRAAQDAVDLPHELVLLDLYAALHALDQLTGATERDEVLHRIFATFCIGK